MVDLLVVACEVASPSFFLFPRHEANGYLLKKNSRNIEGTHANIIFWSRTLMSLAFGQLLHYLVPGMCLMHGWLRQDLYLSFS